MPVAKTIPWEQVAEPFPCPPTSPSVKDLREACQIIVGLIERQAMPARAQDALVLLREFAESVPAEAGEAK